jgi:NAD+ synthase
MKTEIPLDCELTAKAIRTFLKNYVDRVGIKKAVIGLSGGIDSTVTAYLAAEVFGKENLLGIIMPSKANTEMDTNHGVLVAKKLGIRHKIIPIQDMVESFEKNMGTKDIDKIARGNIMARSRMIVLYFWANMEKAVVLGTSDKTEILLGYFTKYGDGGSDIMVIPSLYKTQTKAMGEYLGVPPEIIEKAPSAGLWTGQTAEGEIGIKYDDLDFIMYHLLEKRYSPEEIITKLGMARSDVEKVVRMVRNSEHKRQTPRYPKIGSREINWDYRYPVERS